jgi:hypothetical protein
VHRPLITVLLVLGYREPIIFNDDVTDNEHIGRAIRAAMLKQYLPIHTKVLAYYHANINNPNHRGIVEPLHMRIANIRDELNIYNNAFPYISLYFATIVDDYSDYNEDVPEKYAAHVAAKVSADTFLPHMERRLRQEINMLLPYNTV